MFQSSEAGTNVPTIPPTHSPKREPRREKLCHVMYGSLDVLDRGIKHLHMLGYADPNDWSDPIPSGREGQWMSVLFKYLLIE